jgi:hypothetical protein
VWEPVFDPNGGSVIAPVRQDGHWTLARDGAAFWDRSFVQLWQPRFSPDGARVAAIVAPSYGRWTIAVDGSPWRTEFKDLMSDFVFSPDGRRVAAVGKTGSAYHIVVDDAVWPGSFDMAWKPVFSPDGRQAAAKVEKNGKLTYAVDGRVWKERPRPPGTRCSAPTAASCFCGPSKTAATSGGCFPSPRSPA